MDFEESIGLVIYGFLSKNSIKYNKIVLTPLDYTGKITAKSTDEYKTVSYSNEPQELNLKINVEAAMN